MTPDAQRSLTVSTLATVTLLVTLLAVAGTAIAGHDGGTITVDDDGSADFSSIQAAIDHASDGDSIEVAAGTYAEALTVDKALTIRGPQSGVDARTRSVVSQDEATVRNPGGIVLTVSSGADVTFDGFHFDNSSRFLKTSSSSWDLTLENTVFSADDFEKSPFRIIDPGTLTFQRNQITITGPTNGMWVSPGSAGSVDVTITDNLWRGNVAWMINANGITGTIASNELNGTGADQWGILLASGIQDLTVEDNLFRGNLGGISLWHTFDGTLDIVDNDFLGNEVAALRALEQDETVEDDPKADVTDVKVRFNTFRGDKVQVQHQGVGEWDLRLNDWGVYDEDLVAARTVALYDEVDQTPFLLEDGSPDPGLVRIAGEAPSYLSVSAALDAADAGDTVLVPASADAATPTEWQEALDVSTADVRVCGSVGGTPACTSDIDSGHQQLSRAEWADAPGLGSGEAVLFDAVDTSPHRSTSYFPPEDTKVEAIDDFALDFYVAEGSCSDVELGGTLAIDESPDDGEHDRDRLVTVDAPLADCEEGQWIHVDLHEDGEWSFAGVGDGSFSDVVAEVNSVYPDGNYEISATNVVQTDHATVTYVDNRLVSDVVLGERQDTACWFVSDETCRQETATDRTVVNATGEDTDVVDVEASGVSVSDLTLTWDGHLTESVYGVHVTAKDATVSGNDIELPGAFCDADGCSKPFIAGVVADAPSTVVTGNSIVAEPADEAVLGTWGVNALSDGQVTVADNSITGWGAGVVAWSPTVSVADNQFTGNYRGVHLSGDDADLTGNDISGSNAAVYIAGDSSFAPTDVVLRTNDLAANNVSLKLEEDKSGAEIDARANHWGVLGEELIRSTRLAGADDNTVEVVPYLDATGNQYPPRPVVHCFSDDDGDGFATLNEVGSTMTLQGAVDLALPDKCVDRDDDGRVHRTIVLGDNPNEAYEGATVDVETLIQTGTPAHARAIAGDSADGGARIQATDDQPALEFVAGGEGDGPNAEVDGVTVVADGDAGIDVRSDDVTLADVVTQGADPGLKVRGASDVSVESSTLRLDPRDNGESAIVDLKNAPDASVVDSRLQFDGGGAADGVRAVDSANLLVDGASVDGNLNVDTAGIEVEGASGHEIRSTTITEVSEGIDFTDTEDVTVADSTLQRVIRGVDLFGIRGSTVTGNTIVGAEASPQGDLDKGVIADAGATITDNSISGFKHAVKLDSPPATPPADDILVEDNTLQANALAGVHARCDVVDAEIRANEFAENGFGVQLCNDGALLRDNTFQLTNAEALRVTGATSEATVDARLNDWSVVPEDAIRARISDQGTDNTVLVKPYYDKQGEVHPPRPKVQCDTGSGLETVATPLSLQAAVDLRLPDACEDQTERTVELTGDYEDYNGATATDFEGGAILNYPLDEASGATSFEDVAGDHDATCSGSACPTSGADGQFDAAVDLDGSDDVLTASSQEGLDVADGSEAYTLSAWVKTTDSGSAIVSKMDPDNSYRGYDLFIRNDRLRAHLIHSWSGDAAVVDAASSAPKVNDGQWHQVAVIYDGSGSASGLDLVIDGQDVDEEIAVDSLTGSTSTSAPFQVGARDGEQNLDGKVDEVAFYPKALPVDRFDGESRSNVVGNEVHLVGVPEDDGDASVEAAEDQPGFAFAASSDGGSVSEVAFTGPGTGLAVAADGVSVTNATFEDVHKGLAVAGADDVLVEDSTFRDIGRDFGVGSDIGLEADGTADDPVTGLEVLDNTFRLKPASDHDITAVEVQDADAPVVAENAINGNSYPGSAGIRVGGTADATIVNNSVRSSTSGIHLPNSTGAQVKDNVVLGPEANEVGGRTAGVSIYEGSGHALENNLIVGPQKGLALAGAPDVSVHGGVYAADAVGVELSTASQPTGFEIHDANLTVSATALRLGEETRELTVDATCNDWGVYTEETIQQRIVEGNETNEVVFDPWTDPIANLECLQHPTADFNLPDFVSRTEDAEFNDQSQMGDRPIIERTWTFGDGDSTTTRQGILNVTHRYDEVGTFPVTLTVEDSAGHTDIAVREITVENLAPVLEEIDPPDVLHSHDTTEFFQVNATDAEGDPMTLTTEQDRPWISIQPANNDTNTWNVTLDPNATRIGTQDVVFVLEDDPPEHDPGLDASKVDSQLAPIQVTNPDPEWTSVPQPDPIEVGESLNVTVEAEDPNGDDLKPLSVEEELPDTVNFTALGDGKANISFEPVSDDEDHTLTLNATDEHNASTPAKITFRSGASPLIDAPASEVAVAGDTLQITISVTDPDGTDARTDLFARDDPTGATFTDRLNETGVWTWAVPPTRTADASVTFVADDGDFRTNVTTAIDVRQRPGLAQIPALVAGTDIYTDSLVSGEDVRLRANVTDVDGSVTDADFQLATGLDVPGALQSNGTALSPPVRVSTIDRPAVLLPLDEAAGATSFTNVADPGLPGDCGADCPTAGAQGAVDAAASFDGTDDAVTLGSSSSLDVAAGDAFTLAARVNTTQADGPILSKMDPDAGHQGYDLSLDDGHLQARLVHDLSGDAIVVESVPTVDDDRWHQVAATYDGSGSAAGVTLYVDGEAVDATVEADSLSGDTATSAPFQVAARDGQAYLGATVDEVLLARQALDAETVTNRSERSDVPTARAFPGLDELTATVEAVDDTSLVNGTTISLDVSANEAPTIDAQDQVVVQGLQTVTLDASGSEDPEDRPIDVEWTLPDGTTVENPVAVWSPPSLGQYTATVAVTDNAGATTTKDVQVIVDDRIRGKANLAPGTDQDPSTVSLDERPLALMTVRDTFGSPASGANVTFEVVHDVTGQTVSTVAAQAGSEGVAYARLPYDVQAPTGDGSNLLGDHTLVATAEYPDVVPGPDTEDGHETVTVSFDYTVE